MTAFILVRYVHFLAIFILFALLVVQHLKLEPTLPLAEVKRLSLIDAFYGITAVVVLLAGLSLWLLVGKPAGFYSSNPVFHAKLGLFGLMVLLSIYPTVTFLKLRKSNSPTLAIPKPVVMVVRLELLLFLIIPLLAVFMAQGRGLA
ncbi:DUF2214 family protein [Halioxenophilus aromaticivorans]|uniref:DUF2214 family protein n=1 Tax=Halioxenophilus aromaticivorans TaxID=1306992 RepID=A0AAV3TZG1_9ALTE